MTVRAEPFHLDRFLEEERVRVDEALGRALGRWVPLLPPRLQGPVGDGVRAGGKRIRPILCVAAYRCVAASADAPGDDALYDLAVSLELIHAYSLMHDDLPCMDDAPLRRGRPTPHTVYGEAATILGGAALIPAAALQLWRAAAALGLDRPTAVRLVGILGRAAGSVGMVGGQALDLLGEGRGRPTREEVDGLHGRKTGALLAASLRMGGTAAGAAPAALAALGRYGAEIGLAFQIADDVLDATADAGVLGKLPSDRDLEKSTYVALLGVEGARREAEARVGSALAALESAGLATPSLEALARWVVRRDR